VRWQLPSIGRLLALTLGPAVAAWQPELVLSEEPRAEVETPEVIVSAQRVADAALQAKVEQALVQDPFIFSERVTVRAENDVLRIEGVVYSPHDLRRLLRLVRRIAGKRRIINELELEAEDDDDGTG
jgi:osmotically-inducible protein OsmY